MVLVDKNPFSFLRNPNNAIPVNSIYDNAQDETLPDVQELLGELDLEGDVRPILKKSLNWRRTLPRFPH